jgi:hypothetical protein
VITVPMGWRPGDPVDAAIDPDPPTGTDSRPDQIVGSPCLESLKPGNVARLVGRHLADDQVEVTLTHVASSSCARIRTEGEAGKS